MLLPVMTSSFCSMLRCKLLHQSLVTLLYRCPRGLCVVQEVVMSGQHQGEEHARASSSDQEADSDTSDQQEFLEDYDLQICVCGGHDSEQWLATTDQFDLSR